MRMPPIAGVPFLAWCVSGPSVLMDCPYLRTLRRSMIQGARTKEMRRAVTRA